MYILPIKPTGCPMKVFILSDDSLSLVIPPTVIVVPLNLIGPEEKFIFLVSEASGL